MKSPSPHLANVGHFDKGLVGLLVLVQLQGDVGGVRRPPHVKDPQSHQAGNQGGVVRRVQKQLPVWERSRSLKRAVMRKRRVRPRGVRPVWLRRGALQLLLNVGQQSVQEGSHTQLQVLPVKRHGN